MVLPNLLLARATLCFIGLHPGTTANGAAEPIFFPPDYPPGTIKMLIQSCASPTNDFVHDEFIELIVRTR